MRVFTLATNGCKSHTNYYTFTYMFLWLLAVDFRIGSNGTWQINGNVNYYLLFPPFVVAGNVSEPSLLHEGNQCMLS